MPKLIALKKSQRDYIYKCLMYCKHEDERNGTYDKRRDLLFHKLDSKKAVADGIPFYDPEGEVRVDHVCSKEMRHTNRKCVVYCQPWQVTALFDVTMHYRNIEFREGKNMDFCNEIFWCLDKERAKRQDVPYRDTSFKKTFLGIEL